MRLFDIVDSIVTNQNIEISDKDIIDTVQLLVCADICNSKKTLFKIEKMVKETADIEREDE